MGLDTVELVIAIEKEFEISIPDEVMPHLGRLGDICSFVVHEMQARGELADWSQVWLRLKRLVVGFCAVREELVTPDAHMVDDLGLD